MICFLAQAWKWSRARSTERLALADVAAVAVGIAVDVVAVVAGDDTAVVAVDIAVRDWFD